MTPRRSRPKPMGEEIFLSLRKDILRSDLAPGERLIEEKIAARFGASRTPVREAFLRLEREGLVQRRDKGGFVVGTVVLEDMEEIMDMRAVLEGHAAARAARRVTPELVRRLQEVLDRYEEAVVAGDVPRMVTINTEFHDLLYQASGSRRLKAIIQELRDYWYRFRRQILGLTDMGRRSHEDHVRMVQAIAQGDDRAAEELTREHISRARRKLRQESARGNLEL